MSGHESPRQHRAGLRQVQPAFSVEPAPKCDVGESDVVFQAGVAKGLDSLYAHDLNPWLTTAFTLANGVTLTDIDTAVETLSRGRFAVITGAGLSTDSGIPDYRGEGAPPRNPMTFQTFIGSEEARRRYWAGSQLGWKTFTSFDANDGHRAVADLQRAGWTTGIVTQNVDDLHERGGALSVVHLHGDMQGVTCLSCGLQLPRADLQAMLAELNPWLAEPGAVRLNPDGDVDVEHLDEVRVPPCPRCGGIMKPDVVFFGETVPVDVFDRAAMLVRRAQSVLVAGTSLAVNSAVRLLQIARAQGSPIVIVNRGATRWDERAAVRLEGGTSETLRAIARQLGERTP